MIGPLRPQGHAARTGLAGLVLVLVLAACEGGPLGGPPPTECPTAAPTATEAAAILEDVTTATFDTSLGVFTITLNAAAAPIASANFVALARCDFYDGVTFHRVLAGFVAQAGDPNTRDNQGDFEGLGTGGPGYTFTVEIPPEGLNYDPYTVAMGNRNTLDSNGSQFFICLTDLDASFTDRIYTIFGLVTDGREVVDAIGQVEVISPITGVPVDPVVIRNIELSGPVEPAESTPSAS
ncbi:MAG TPA: peptidylprolyl isomerase [Candidatus Limnocylindria bacterium]|nr:peptidylprolyl isomerase [Candidatus Limnocylindria bacterium]